AVLRIDVEDLIDGDVDTGADIASTLDQLDISPSQVALVVDGGTLTRPPTIQATVATQALMRDCRADRCHLIWLTRRAAWKDVHHARSLPPGVPRRCRASGPVP